MKRDFKLKYYVLTVFLPIEQCHNWLQSLHCQQPTTTTPSPPMTNSVTAKHQLYTAREIKSVVFNQTQHHVFRVENIESIIMSMNDLIMSENKRILMKRILTLRLYHKLSNALQDRGPLGSINKIYLN
jgi:hypothetical protein